MEEGFDTFLVIEDVMADLRKLLETKTQEIRCSSRGGIEFHGKLHTECAPAERPKMVTSFLSPPNASILS